MVASIWMRDIPLERILYCLSSGQCFLQRVPSSKVNIWKTAPNECVPLRQLCILFCITFHLRHTFFSECVVIFNIGSICSTSRFHSVTSVFDSMTTAGRLSPAPRPTDPGSFTSDILSLPAVNSLRARHNDSRLSTPRSSSSMSSSIWKNKWHFRFYLYSSRTWTQTRNLQDWTHTLVRLSKTRNGIVNI